MSRARGWCFTLNNYVASNEHDPTHGDCPRIIALVPEFFRFICFGREVGESGTPHLQGYLYAKQPLSLSQCRERIGNAHFEISRGTPAQAIEYCKKDGDFDEAGEAPVSNAFKGASEKARWDEARTAAESGDLVTIPSDIYLRYYRTLKEIAKDHMVKPDDACECTGVWIYGRAGIGKSRKAREDFPGSYLKMANKWWDGYQHEDTVIIDDIDTKHDCLAHHFKIWGDRYSFIAETKGGAIQIRPKKIVITSQYSIDQIWHDSETIDALKRRYRIIHMDGFDELPRHL